MLPLEGLTVGELLRRTTQKYPQQPAVRYKGQSLSYREFLSTVRGYVARLLAGGVCPGDHVALWAEPDPESLCLYYAIQDMGAVAVMLNTSLLAGEAQHLLDSTETTTILVGRSYHTENDLVCRTAELARREALRVWLLDSVELQQSGLPTLPAGYASEEGILRVERAVEPQDTAVILFTSGSTSNPKGVMTSHYSRVNGGIQQAHDMCATSADRFCVSMPFFHCFCISVNLMSALAVGGCVCLPEDRHTANIIKTIAECGCTVLSSVPTMYHVLIRKNQGMLGQLSTLRTGIIGGANYPPEEFVQIEQALGPQFCLLSSLGQTETTAGLTISHYTDSLDVRSRTVGHFMDHVEGKLIDIHTGETLPVGQCGEICVRGYLTMQGYCNEPEQTAKTLDTDGWVHTGDLGQLDEEGNITLKGRCKELIIRGGENISPCEIEMVLETLPQVECCKVVGVPDAHYGEEICACIQPVEGQHPDSEAVRTYLREHLAAYKQPKYLLYWPALPATAIGKINQAECKRQARCALEAKRPDLADHDATKAKI